ERQADRALQQNHEQLNTVELQLKQSQEERDELDKKLPRGGGPLATRLQAAEKTLAALEAHQPHDARRQMSQRDAQSAESRIAELDLVYRKAKRAWRGALRAAGLPENTTLRDLRELAARSDELASSATRLATLKEEI